MNEVDAANSGADAPEPVVIAVIRTGGLTGVPRQWRVAPAEPDAEGWVSLVEQCPWDEPVEIDQRSRDRYVWRIEVRMPEEEREREMPESALVGAWRELVEAVRAAPRPERP